MRLAMIGLGRMGGNMSERLMKGGHEVIVFDRSADAVSKYVGMGAVASSGAADAASKMKTPRIVWVMVPAGKPTEDTISELSTVLGKGDVIIDGGNSNFHDSMRRAADLAPKGIEFI